MNLNRKCCEFFNRKEKRKPSTIGSVISTTCWQIGVRNPFGAKIHEALYGTTSITRADFSDYIRSLAEALLSAYARNLQRVHLEISVEPLLLNPDKAITLAMVLNELINNSCKHAFTDGTDGEIRIDLKKSESKMMLSYTDNGKGIPSLSEDRENPPIGMRLLSLLVKQLNGTMRYKSSHLGTVFQIEFTR